MTGEDVIVVHSEERVSILQSPTVSFFVSKYFYLGLCPNKYYSSNLWILSIVLFPIYNIQ